LEERHLQERYQTCKQQVKDQFHLQRHQLVLRHDKVNINRYDLDEFLGSGPWFAISRLLSMADSRGTIFGQCDL